MNRSTPRFSVRFALLPLLVLGLTALVAAGCGDDGSGSSGSATTGTSEVSETTQGGSGGSDRDCHGGTDAGESGSKSWERAPEWGLNEGASYTAMLTTSSGTMVAELLPEEAPCAVNNFVFLAREGFYKEVPFHRIIKDFMVQTGDPTGTGGGGPGYTIKDDEVSLEYTRGVLAMANTGQPDTAGSQFFIVHGESAPLPKTYTIFGRITEGLDVLDKIAATPVEDNGMGEPSKPTKRVVLQQVSISES